MNAFLSRLPDDFKETTNPMVYSLGKCRRFEIRNPRVPDTVLSVIGYILLRKETWVDPSTSGRPQDQHWQMERL